MFESMRIYIERNGRAYNYLPSVNELNVKREEHLTVEEEETKKMDEEKDQEEFKEDEETGRSEIYASIHVETKQHKGMVIGKKGSMLQKIVM